MDTAAGAGRLAGGPLVGGRRSSGGRCDDHGLGIGHEHAVFTHDLDFGTALALTHAGEPSVIQVRAQRVLPEHIGPMVLASLKQYERELSAGALVVVEPAKSRVRVLPL